MLSILAECGTAWHDKLVVVVVVVDVDEGEGCVEGRNSRDGSDAKGDAFPSIPNYLYARNTN